MRIISWNIQWGRGADGRVDLGRTIAAIGEAGGGDVICLQEVAQSFPGLPGGHGEDGVAILSEAFPDHEVVFGPALDVSVGRGGRARFGNLILSCLPVEQVFRHLLPCPADPAVPGMQRSCVEVVLNAPFGPLRVLTTHLEYYSQRQRAAQVRALGALQDEIAGYAGAHATGKEVNPVFTPRRRPVSAVVCGDFNCEPDSPEYLLMSSGIEGDRPRWRDAWGVVHGEAPHAATVGLHGAEWPDRQYCCDYMWVTDDVAPRVVDFGVATGTDASDHQPVWLELRN